MTAQLIINTPLSIYLLNCFDGTPVSITCQVHGVTRSGTGTLHLFWHHTYIQSTSGPIPKLRFIIKLEAQEHLIGDVKNIQLVEPLSPPPASEALKRLLTSFKNNVDQGSALLFTLPSYISACHALLDVYPEERESIKEVERALSTTVSALPAAQEADQLDIGLQLIPWTASIFNDNLEELRVKDTHEAQSPQD
jgi:hypothetical protein